MLNKFRVLINLTKYKKNKNNNFKKIKHFLHSKDNYNYKIKIWQRVLFIKNNSKYKKKINQTNKSQFLKKILKNFKKLVFIIYL